MYDYLKPILGDELFTQFCEKMEGATGITLANIADGAYIPKNKFDNVNEKVKTLNAQISELNGKLAAAQQQSGSAAAMNEQINQLNAQVSQLTNEVAARDQKLEAQALGYKIKDALRGMNVRNADVVIPLLKMDAISLKDDKLVGLQEQVDEIRKTDGYLFNAPTGSRGGFSGGVSGSEIGGQDINSSVNAAIRSMSGRG